MAITNSAERMRLHRDCIRNGETVPICGCGRQLKGRLSKERSLCSYCWKRTDEAKAKTLERVRKHRKKLGKAVNV